MPKGWRSEPARHALASRGIKTKILKTSTSQAKVKQYESAKKDFQQSIKDYHLHDGKYPYDDTGTYGSGISVEFGELRDSELGRVIPTLVIDENLDGTTSVEFNLLGWEEPDVRKHYVTFTFHKRTKDIDMEELMENFAEILEEAPQYGWGVEPKVLELLKKGPTRIYEYSV